jgi:HlyD family secretion protein
MDRPLELAWWQQRNWRRAGVGLAAALLIAWAAAGLLGRAEHSVRLKATGMVIAPVTRAQFHDFVPLRATVVALDTVYLDALEGGRVEQILAQPGDFVEKDQPLVILGNTELELDVLDREARLIESITQLQSYETQLEQNRVANQKALAQMDYDITRLQRALARRKKLVEGSAEAAEVRDSLQDELDLALKTRPLQAESNEKQEQLRVKQIPQIQDQQRKLQEDLVITHSKLANLAVKAPTPGRLTSMDLKVGENLNRGGRLAVITPQTGSKLSAQLDEFYLGRVRNGQPAQVESGGKTWTLQVARVYPQVKDGTFTVDFNFDGPTPEGLLPGQALQGRLELGADRMATIIPSGAFLERTGGNWIFVLSKDGSSAHRRTIRTGQRNAEQVEVLANLVPGERVIVSDYSSLENVQRIDLER